MPPSAGEVSRRLRTTGGFHELALDLLQEQDDAEH
jgi:hypothetical protein